MSKQLICKNHNRSNEDCNLSQKLKISRHTQTNQSGLVDSFDLNRSTQSVKPPANSCTTHTINQQLTDPEIMGKTTPEKILADSNQTGDFLITENSNISESYDKQSEDSSPHLQKSNSRAPPETKTRAILKTKQRASPKIKTRASLKTKTRAILKPKARAILKTEDSAILQQANIEAANDEPSKDVKEDAFVTNKVEIVPSSEILNNDRSACLHNLADLNELTGPSRSCGEKALVKGSIFGDTLEILIDTGSQINAIGYKNIPEKILPRPKAYQK